MIDDTKKRDLFMPGDIVTLDPSWGHDLRLGTNAVGIVVATKHNWQPGDAHGENFPWHVDVLWNDTSIEHYRGVTGVMMLKMIQHVD